MSATGYAILEHGEIKIRTVSDTRRAAIVNWLCAERHLLTLAVASDQSLEEMWQHNRGTAEAVRVVVQLSS